MWVKKVVSICNKGLHSAPATEFVTLVTKLSASQRCGLVFSSTVVLL